MTFCMSRPSVSQVFSSLRPYAAASRLFIPRNLANHPLFSMSRYRAKCLPAETNASTLRACAEKRHFRTVAGEVKLTTETIQPSDIRRAAQISERGLVETAPAGVCPVSAYLSNLAPGSRRTMEQSLRLAASVLLDRPDAPGLAHRTPWHLVRRHHVQVLRAALERTHRPASVNKLLSAVRGVLHEAWCAGSIATDDYRRAVDVRSMKADPLLRGRALTQPELAAVITTCNEDGSNWGVRDAAIITTMYGAGLRRAELAGLHLGDYDPMTGAIIVRGKGRKDRVTYLGSALRGYVDAWIEARGDHPGHFFLPVGPTGELQARPLSTQAIMMIMRRRASEAGIEAFSPHDLRRSFVTDLLDSGEADLSVVAKLCGHSSIRTTARYDRRGESAKTDAVEVLRIDTGIA